MQRVNENGSYRRDLVDAVTDVVVKANRTTIADMKEGSNIAMCEALLEMMEPEISEAKAKAKADGIIEGLIKAYVDMGLSIEEISEKVKKSVDEVQNIIDAM